MTRIIQGLIWLLSASLAGADSLPDVVDRVRPAVVGIGTIYVPPQKKQRRDAGTYLATGFVVGSGLQIITNAHALPSALDIDNGESLAVFSGRGARATAHVATVERVDEEHDLALLAIQGTALPALEFGDSTKMREGQEVAFTGFPAGMVLGLYAVTHRGIISSIIPMARPADNSRTLTAAQLRALRNLYDVFQLDATAYPGNSGSPVYEVDTGRVVGVLNSVFIKESRESLLQKPSGISYAIPADYARRLLEQ